jgi:hypothetical protein
MQSAGLRMKCLVLSVVLFASVATADPDLYDDYINSPGRRPFVAFLARRSPGPSGLPGHAFVAVGVELSNGLRVYERVFGYAVRGDNTFEEVKAVFTRVSGDLSSSLRDISWTVEFRVQITAQQRDAVLQIVERWRGSDPKYNLFARGGKNCSAFAGEVAGVIGLNVPPGAGSKPPVDYITELKARNPH